MKTAILQINGKWVFYLTSGDWKTDYHLEKKQFETNKMAKNIKIKQYIFK